MLLLLNLIQFQSVLFRKRWRNASKYKRETTIRTAPTECYPDNSDDGTVIKSQETILVRMNVAHFDCALMKPHTHTHTHQLKC